MLPDQRRERPQIDLVSVAQIGDRLWRLVTRLLGLGLSTGPDLGRTGRRSGDLKDGRFNCAQLG